MSNIVQSSRRRSAISFVAPPKPKIPVESEVDDAEGTDKDNDVDDDDEDDEDDDDDEEDDDGSQSEEFNDGKLLRIMLKLPFISILVTSEASKQKWPGGLSECGFSS